VLALDGSVYFFGVKQKVSRQKKKTAEGAGPLRGFIGL